MGPDYSLTPEGPPGCFLGPPRVLGTCLGLRLTPLRRWFASLPRGRQRLDSRWHEPSLRVSLGDLQCFRAALLGPAWPPGMGSRQRRKRGAHGRATG